MYVCIIMFFIINMGNSCNFSTNTQKDIQIILLSKKNNVYDNRGKMWLF